MAAPEIIPAAVPPVPAHAPDVAAVAVDTLLADTRSEATRKAYAGDLRYFFRWMGHEDSGPAAVAALCSLSGGAIALRLNGYKAAMREAGLSEATVNRRLAAVRALLRMARKLGADVPDPAGLVDSEKVTPYRDTRGPVLENVRRLLDAPDRRTLKGKRDYALLVLFASNALRRGELYRADVADFDPKGRRLWILGKGRGTQKEPITLQPPAVAALRAYLKARGNPAPDAPLFANVARFEKGEGRLTGRGLYHVVNTYGRKVLGAKLNPHALRHSAITAALDSGADVRHVQKLSRHKDVRTLQLYDDNRTDMAGQVSARLCELLGLPMEEE